MRENEDPFESAQTYDEIELTMMRELGEAVKQRQPQRIIQTENAGLRALIRIENNTPRKEIR